MSFPHKRVQDPGPGLPQSTSSRFQGHALPQVKDRRERRGRLGSG